MQLIEPTTTISLDDDTDLRAIAANVVKWNRDQERAFAKRPLAYVDALLGQMREAGSFDLGRIGEALMELLPELTERESDELVAVFMRGH